MKKCKAFLAAFLVVPLLALGGEFEASGVSTTAAAPQWTSSSQYECCWIYFMGRWTCVPC